MLYYMLKSKTVLPVGERVRRFGLNGVGRGEEQQNKNKGSLFTKETVGMTLLLFSAVIFFIAVTGRYVFGEIGLAITAFFVGLTGYFVYPLLLLAMYASAVMVFGKKFVPARWIVRVYLLLAVVFFIVHTATSERFFGEGYGSYLAGCWSAAGESIAQGTGGGILFGLIAYPVRAALSAVGAYILYALLVLLALWFILIATPLRAVLLPSARMRKEKPAEEKQPVTFGDLPEPERSAAFDRETVPSAAPAGAPSSAPVYPSAPVQTAPAQPVTAQPVRKSSLDEARAMLFQGDPASSYKNNLIFDRDSRFNTYPRRSSVGPVEAGAAQPSARAPQAEPAQTSGMSYTERYTAETSDTRPAMPRQVTQVRPAPSVISDDDFNYPQSPSYRAPSEPAIRDHDFYANDVAAGDASETAFSSQPTVDDYEIPARPTYEAPVEPARPTYEQPAEPARPTYEAPVEPARPTYEQPAEPARPTYEQPVESARPTYEQPAEPVRPTYEQSAEPARSTYEQPAEPVRPTYEAPVERSETAADLSRSRESEFRNLFSQPVEERTRVEDVPPPADRQERFSRYDDELPAGSRVFESPVRDSAADLFDGDQDDEEDVADFRRDDGMSPLPVRERGERGAGMRAERSLRTSEPAAPIPAEEAPVPEKHVYKPYVYPDLNDLVEYPNTSGVSQEEIEQNSAVIVDTLAGFRVDAEVIRVTIGATVTRYDIDIPRNIAVSQVIKRDAEIAMRLHTRDGVNIYSNSEMGAISIEVPNSVRSTVGLKSVMQSDEYVHSKPGSLMFAIGQDVEGRNVCGNIVKMTHVLVAGSTNSGKSVCLDSMLISLICKYSPEELRLILIDPKKTEFIVFDGLPHLMINEIISDAQKAVAAFNWAIKEMERRYTLFEKKTRGGVNVRNIDEYNNALTEDEEKLPKIVIVVDELADLMSVAKKDIEERIQRLTQKSRAAGIHLVLATQRPSVDVITGVIKGNLPTRMALRVISDVDSRTILDESGAQKLLGNGDMLFRTGGMFNSLRVQGAFVSSKEMQAVVQDVKTHNEAYFDSSVADFINKTEGDAGVSGGGGDADDGAVDPQYIKALGIVVNLGQASISLIQRKCSVGYNHAGKIIEWMELMGYISPFDGKAKARAVLLSKEDFEAKYGDLN